MSNNLIIDDVDKWDSARVQNAERVQCPVCEAEPGKPCQDSLNIYGAHVARENLALEAKEYVINFDTHDLEATLKRALGRVIVDTTRFAVNQYCNEVLSAFSDMPNLVEKLSPTMMGVRDGIIERVEKAKGTK